MKSVLVSGGSAGIGEATVKKFVEQGYQVFNFDKDEPSHALPHTHYIACDVSETAQIMRGVSRVLELTEALDVVVGAAGQHFSGTIEETSEAEFDRIMGINIKGTFFLLKHVLPILRQRNSGSVVLVASDQSFVGKSHSAVYGASKAAIAQLAKSTALDYAPFNIRVNAVCPGTIDTPLYRRAIQQYHDKTGIALATIEAEEARMQPLRRIGTAEEVAELIFFLGSDASGYVTGSLFSIDGGYTAR